MKRTSNISATGSKSGQVDTTPHRSSSVFIISFLVLGASFLVLGALTIGFYRLHTAPVLAWLFGMLATAVLIGLFVLFSYGIYFQKALPRLTRALISALKDPDPDVRAKAIEGLAELDLEQASHYHQHNTLDNILISTLKEDPDPHVRAKAVEGLAELDLEQASPPPA